MASKRRRTRAAIKRPNTGLDLSRGEEIRGLAERIASGVFLGAPIIAVPEMEQGDFRESAKRNGPLTADFLREDFPDRGHDCFSRPCGLRVNISTT
jgi:hypothetical protein